MVLIKTGLQLVHNYRHGSDVSKRLSLLGGGLDPADVNFYIAQGQRAAPTPKVRVAVDRGIRWRVT
jgi:hypothetical protein